MEPADSQSQQTPAATAVQTTPSNPTTTAPEAAARPPLARRPTPAAGIAPSAPTVERQPSIPGTTAPTTQPPGGAAAAVRPQLQFSSMMAVSIPAVSNYHGAHSFD